MSEEDPLINGTGSPASLTNPEASPRAESHGLLTKEEEDDEMRDSGVEHIWPDNDMLSASVDGTGECLESGGAEMDLISSQTSQKILASKKNARNNTVPNKLIFQYFS